MRRRPRARETRREVATKGQRAPAVERLALHVLLQVRQGIRLNPRS